jgi:diaminohydroxyphosphoribosylaminopyrimidine deaminase/5-amino-6-(5-phosphoribosylamino)uracil reductase
VVNDAARDAADVVFMERALFWAERGRGRTSPNPIVGAVVVTGDGVVAGQGAHLVAGGPHAEVHALDEAGVRAAGGTLYCTLEPCCHVGRTGPCVERIVAARIARVVASVQDPNPRVAGRGFEYLRGQGIAVERGVGAAGAWRQNAAFLTWMRHRRPFVILKTAVSADGFVGSHDRRVKLTGEAADRWFQRQRAEVDAIAVGAGTVLVDDPQLTARDVFRPRPLTRVIVDWRVRVEGGAQVFSTVGEGPVIMVVLDEAARGREHHLEQLAARGVTIERFAVRDLAEVMGRLAAHGVLSLLVEGGPTLQNAFTDAALVDRVQCVRTPHRLGTGVPAPSVVTRQPPDREIALGADIVSEFDVHRVD